MGMNCGCPAGAHLADLTIADCKESFGQIQKVLIQRIFKSTGVKNKFTVAEIGVKSEMVGYMASQDGQKIIISPYIQNPTTTPGEPRTFGGGNATLGGVEMIIGREPTTFEGIIYQESQDTIKVMKSYGCEEIGVFLIDEYGNIGGISVKNGDPEYDISTGECIMPIPIRSFFVGDKNLGGYEEPDSNTIRWSFVPNWSDRLIMVKQSTMDYNPLTDLVNVSSGNG